MPTADTHPSKQALAAFADGRLPEDLRLGIEAHVAECAACCATLERAEGDGLLGLAQQAMMATPQSTCETPLDSDVTLPPELADHPRYRIIGQLGAGGMGVVYKAEHRVMGRTVALKVMNPQAMRKPGAAERFRREVRLASRLQHPNIVTAYDADEAGGRHFLVMEFVEGISLDRLVAKRSPLPIAMVCHFARQAAIGLQHAADKGMVHRDIKPHNLMVTRKGQVKILDFGLACVAHVEGEEPTSPTAAQMTAPEMVLGTPDFLSPEQARKNSPVDGRADLYALGCTLYYLLTGKPPFLGNSGFEKLIAHIQDEAPDARVERPDVPSGLSAAIRKLMAKEPGNRYQTPAEVATVLAPFAKGGTDGVGPGQVLNAIPVGDAVPSAVPVVMATPVPVVAERETVAEFDRVGPTPADTRAPFTPRARTKSRRRKADLPFLGKNRGLVVAAVVAAVVLAGSAYAAIKYGGSTTQPSKTGTPSVASNSGQPGASRPKTQPERKADVGPAPVTVNTSTPTVLIVLPPQGLYYTDYGPLREALERGQVRVQTATPGKRPSRRHTLSTQGPDETPDLALESVDPSQFAAVVFVGAGVEDYLPGGKSVASARRVIDGLKAAPENNPRIVAAICLGLKVLGENGYLDGKPAARSQFYQNPPSSVNWRPDPIVSIKPFITARSDNEADALGRQIADHVRRAYKP